MDIDKTNRDLYRGENAKMLLDNPVLQEAFADIEKEIFEIWQNTKTGQQELREEAWLNHRAMKMLKLKLENWLNNGKIAKAEIEKAEKKKKNKAASPYD